MNCAIGMHERQASEFTEVRRASEVGWMMAGSRGGDAGQDRWQLAGGPLAIGERVTRRTIDEVAIHERKNGYRRMRYT